MNIGKANFPIDPLFFSYAFALHNVQQVSSFSVKNQALFVSKTTFST